MRPDYNNLQDTLMAYYLGRYIQDMLKKKHFITEGGFH